MLRTTALVEPIIFLPLLVDQIIFLTHIPSQNLKFPREHVTQYKKNAVSGQKSALRANKFSYTSPRRFNNFVYPHPY